MKNIFQQSAKKPETECKVCLDYKQVVDRDPHTGRKIFMPCPKCTVSEEEVQELVNEVQETFGTSTGRVSCTEEHTSTPPTQQKDLNGKVPMHFVLVDMADEVRDICKVMGFGYEKYKKRCGWQTVDIDEYKGAVERHLNAFYRGEMIDTESGCFHLAHAAINCLFMLFLAKRANNDSKVRS